MQDDKQAAPKRKREQKLPTGADVSMEGAEAENDLNAEGEFQRSSHITCATCHRAAQPVS